MTINKFPKILALGDKAIQSIFDGEVEITEKIDGSMIGFGRINGELCIRSKGRHLDIDNPDSMFKAGVEYLKFIQDRLSEGTMYYGEYLRAPKHNALTYERIPQNHIALFAMSYPSEDGFTTLWAEYEDIVIEASLLQIDVVRKLNLSVSGETIHHSLTELLNLPSLLGKAKIEGIVIKNYSKQAFVGGQVLPIMMGKYVSEEFKEIHRKDWKKENTGKGRWETFKSQYACPPRWRKAVEHLRDNGVLTDSPRDIAGLIREVNKDIELEEKDNIKDFLWDEFGRELLRSSTRGIAEWYKQYLLDLMSNDNQILGLYDDIYRDIDLGGS